MKVPNPIRVFCERTQEYYGDPNAPQVYEGTRAILTIKEARFPATITRVSKNYVKLVFDDGMSVRATFKKENGPCLPSMAESGTWEVLSWENWKTDAVVE